MYLSRLFQTNINSWCEKEKKYTEAIMKSCYSYIQSKLSLLPELTIKSLCMNKLKEDEVFINNRHRSFPTTYGSLATIVTCCVCHVGGIFFNYGAKLLSFSLFSISSYNVDIVNKKKKQWSLIKIKNGASKLVSCCGTHTTS